MEHRCLIGTLLIHSGTSTPSLSHRSISLIGTRICVLFTLQASSTAASHCTARCLQPVSWCLPFNATLLFSTVKQCQLTKLLCPETWFFKQNTNKQKTKQNQKQPAPEPFSKCLDSKCMGKATAANLSPFKPRDLVALSVLQTCHRSRARAGPVPGGWLSKQKDLCPSWSVRAGVCYS